MLMKTTLGEVCEGEVCLMRLQQQFLLISTLRRFALDQPGLVSFAARDDLSTSLSSLPSGVRETNEIYG